MLKRLITPALAATLFVAACDTSPTGSQVDTQASDDYALVMFGESGSALEGLMGPTAGGPPFDGSTLRAPLPDSLALTDEQIAAMRALREAFRAEHQDELAALRAIFEAARAARQAGATREEVHAILIEARPIVEALRADVQALHEALRAVLTDAQREWLAANRPPHVPNLPHRRRMGPG
jgi:Spy/CpxP family protein refolding chaperone